MKILSLRFCNLNSLKGTWHIDFASPDFDDGIFAITGHTGSGKTTILDAICLAIYGQTPRLKTISQNANELMSLGTGECFSQVVLMVDGKLYRFGFVQHRAGRKADGKLQVIKREIARLAHPDDQQGHIIESKASACDQLASSLTKMSFEQFTRSVLLAQGNFAVFLQASASDKGAILEQITGSQIYADIGKKTYEITKSKEAALERLYERLDEHTLMPTEEFHALADTIAHNETLLTQQLATLNTLETQITQSAHYHQLQIAQAHENTLLARVQSQITDFADDSQRLAQANRAYALRLDYQKLDALNDRLNQARTQALTNQQALERLHTQHQTLSINHDTAKHRLDALSQEAQNSQALFDAVNDIDTAIRDHHQKLDGIQKNQDTISQNCDALSAQYTQLGAEQQRNRDALDDIARQLRQFFTHDDAQQYATTDSQVSKDAIDTLCTQQQSQLNTLNLHHRLLKSTHTKLGQIQQTLSRDRQAFDISQTTLQSKRQHYKSTLSDHKSAEQRIDSTCTTLNTLITDFISQTMPSADPKPYLITDASTSSPNAFLHHIQDLRHKADKLRTTLSTLATSCASIRRLHSTLDHQNNQLATEQTALNTQQANFDQLAKSHDAQQAALAIMEQNHELYQDLMLLKEHLANLDDGTPCPLCGSMTHPYKYNPPSQDSQHISLTDKATIKAHKAQLEQTNHRLSEQKDALTHLTSKLHHDAQMILHTQNSLDHERHLAKDKLDSLTNDVPTFGRLWQVNLRADLDTFVHGDLLDQWQEAITALSDTLENKHAHSQMLYDQLRTDIHHEQQLKIQLEHIRAEGLDHRSQCTQMAYQFSSALSDAQRELSERLPVMRETVGLIDPATLDWQAIDDFLAHTLADKQADNLNLSALNLDTARLNGAMIVFDALTIQLDDTITAKQAQMTMLSALSNQADTHRKRQHELEIILGQLTIRLDEQHKSFGALQDEYNAIAKTLGELTQKRQSLFGDRKVADEQQELAKKLDEARSALQDIKNQQQSTLQQSDYHRQELDKLNQVIASTDTLLTKSQADFADKLHSSGFDDHAAFLAAELDDGARLALTKRAEALTQALNDCQRQLARLNAEVEAIVVAHPQVGIWQIETLQTQKDAIQATYREQLEAHGKNKERHERAQSQYTRHQALRDEIDLHEQHLGVWKNLNSLIGSKEGTTYRNFAQGLTLAWMLGFANEVLAKMSNRYILVTNDDRLNPLEIGVIDIHQGSELRSTRNLSGGETFIVSLALALGLSQMTSQNVSIDSFFLDEGFGTLDEEALDVALSVLSMLKDDGKLIGIISHVASLKERIPSQIKVITVTNGQSRLEGSGVQAIA